jgi:ribosomal protein S18 acetylase RimI-like enzyme
MLSVTMNKGLQNSSQLCIRNATAIDAASIVRLIRQLGDDAEVTEAYVLQYLSGTERAVLLAQRGDAVEGLLSYSVRADLFHAGNSVLIEELVVDEKYRGEGIGDALMKALLDRLRGLDCKEVCLAVMPDNEGAIRFYKRHGLVEEALFLERHIINTPR